MPSLEQFLGNGYTLEYVRGWAKERITKWNMLQPLEGNPGWVRLVADAKAQAVEISRDIEALDVTPDNAERRIMQLHAKWAAQMDLTHLLDDAKKANQEAINILSEIEVMEKEPGNA